MIDIQLAFRFAAALGLGILLGLERERAHQDDPAFAGVRTLALMALLGAAAAYLTEQLALPWLIIVTFGALAALVTVSYAYTSRQGDVGVTTEVTALLVFLLGAMCVWGHVGVAAAVAAASALLLALKDWLHRLARRIEPHDVSATLKFAIITVIILPLLPNQGYGPPGLEVLNPYRIWLMVVLISGLNFVSYVLVKVVGGEHGLGLTGLLGGLVSSTAVTLGFSQRSRQTPALALPLALGILLAWSVMFVRVLITVTVVNPALAGRLLAGLGLMGGVSVLVSLWLWRRRAGAQASTTASAGQNPFELGEALKFGVLFGVVIFVARAAEVYLGAAGLYLAGALAGLTDVDAISLSMAQLAADPSRLGVAARTVIIAVLSNTLVKGGMVFFTADPGLRRALLPGAGLVLAAGAVAAVLVG